MSARRDFLRSFCCIAFGMAASVPLEAVSGLHRPLDLLNRRAASDLPGEGAIELESANSRLVDGFRWAKWQALQYVRNTGSVRRWYEAALLGRNAFCMRDVSHMSTGAQFLGLGARTRNMLHLFAQHISASKEWCSWWEITGEDEPAQIDYRSDHDFWYDLPANFDVLDACYRQWLWSRDNFYIDDPVFLNYYRRTVSSYVEAWDRKHNGLLDHLPSDGHMGIGTYDEDLQDNVSVGADLLAAQYAAYRDYAEMARARGDGAGASDFAGKAEALKSLYNQKWWDPTRQAFWGALGAEGQFEKETGTGRSTMEFPLYYGLPDPGAKTQCSLDRLEQQLHPGRAAQHGIIGGVEGVSYLPDIFYKYGRSRSAWTVLLALIDPHLKRREYPEVSFTVAGNIGSGLMGISPSPQPNTVETLPQLTSETEWAALHHVPVGNNTISIRHTQTHKTELTSESGGDLTWKATFPGAWTTLLVDRRAVPARQETRAGGYRVSWCEITVRTGETHVAEHT